jgi:hypothetical protein
MTTQKRRATRNRSKQIKSMFKVMHTYIPCCAVSDIAVRNPRRGHLGEGEWIHRLPSSMSGSLFLLFFFFFLCI